MASSFLSIYSDSWTLSERPGSNLIQLDALNATGSDSGSSSARASSTHVGGPTITPLLRPLTTEPEPEFTEPLLTDGDLAAMSIAQRSSETLRRVSESMRHENVPVSPQLVMHRHAWDVQPRVSAQTRFPLDHVPIKCNILQTLRDLLREYLAAAGTESSTTTALEHVAKVLHYLSKLIQAAQLDASAMLRHGSAASETTHQRGGSTSFEDASSVDVEAASGSVSGVGSGRSRIFSRFFAPSKSRRASTPYGHARAASVATKSTITVVPVGTSGASTSVSASVSASAGSVVPTQPVSGSSHKIQDYTSMHTYQESIAALGVVLQTLPQTDQNNIIFHFVDQKINAFIIKDCRALLRFYVEEEIISRL
ncbi:LAME_0F11540g1_1 [Lachancea meyersii CBS 8951]|uniref:LAME_0F11540g1_1 n=1 Tax=Lachancea meyersii CBS 8951 TaxID=1266667 RepID=A0A1G4JW54_9SACH|nr:LAME_0F11540g1_1 [Lachancea meyersii CBS 8951]